MFDAAIIGTGPAGISAALTLQSRNKNFIWLGSRQLSQKISSAEKIRNYPGLDTVSGDEMRETFLRQIDSMGIKITEKTVTGVFKTKDYYTVLCDQTAYSAYSVILTTGVASRGPIPGELEFLGKGVSYCATCDGFLYNGKTIAVVCTSKEFENEIEYLASVAAKVYLIPLYKDCEISESNIEMITTVPKEIKGEKKAETLCFADCELAVDGVFLLKDAVSPGVLVNGIEECDGHISVNRVCETNLEGIFAAGDCTGKPYQYAKAVGEGNVAAHSCIKYLARNRFKTIKPSERTLKGLIDAVDRNRLPNEEQIEKNLFQNLTYGAFELVPLGNGEKAVKGDVVTFSVTGGEGRYDRKGIRLTIGQGIYDKAVESAMEGCSAGDTINVTVGANTLTIEIIEVSRKQLPTLTNEMVVSKQIEGVNTVEEYRTRIKEELTMNEIHIIAGEILNDLFEAAPDPDYDDETISILGELEVGFFDGHFKETVGKGIHEMTPDELEEQLGCRTTDEFVISRREWYKTKIKQSFVLSKELGVSLAGEYDIRKSYEALGKLQMKAVELIKRELTGGENYGA